MRNKKLYKQINELSKVYKDDAVKLAQRLIQTPSISGEEGAVADIVMEEMEKLGYDECFKDEQGNIVGIINGTEEGPTIMFNSHIDHVDAGDPDNWEGYDPYGGEIDVCQVDNQDRTGTEKVECIHGRAASDTKGGQVSQIYAGAALVKLRAMGYSFKGKFMFTGVVLEEPAEMVGMKHLIDKTLPARGLTYDAMVSSEASSLKLYCGHRGRVEMLATIYGRTSHASSPWLGVNAIYKAVPLISVIKDELYPKLLATSDPDLGQSSISINIIECKPGALSIVPDRCMLSIDRRLLPGETVEKAIQEIQNIIDDLAAKDPEFKADVVVKKVVERSYTGLDYVGEKVMAAWKIDKDHGFVKVAAEALKALDQPVKYGYWEFGTDASKTAGIDRKPTIGYSPMQEQYAHTPYDKVRTDYI